MNPPSPRPLVPALFCLGLSVSPAMATEMDFAEEAERRMKLSFDLEEVEGMLNMPSPAQQYGQSMQPALPLEPNSEMRAATVLRDRALITRVRKVPVGKGAASLQFEGLPLGLNAESLHASLLAGDGRITGVELVSGQGEVEETERIQAVREEMLRITEELGQVKDHIESLLMQRAYLRGTLLQSNAERAAPTLDQVKGTLDYVGEAEREIATKLRKQEQTAATLAEELNPLLIKLANPLATGMTVRVDLDAAKVGEAEVALRYQVTGARWWPSYNARLDEKTGQVSVEYYGVVSQQTGEDWSDVELQLSTANPSTSGALPSLDSWYLGRDNYYNDYSVVNNLMDGRGYYQDPGNRREANPAATAPGGMVDSQMSASVRGTGAVVFSIPGRRTVAGDGSQQRIAVGTQTFDTAMELASVPKLVPEVFRQARLRYAGDVPLLPGPVSTYVGADFMGAGQLEGALPGEDLLLSFGTDDRVKVERQLISRQQESAGKRTTRWTFHFRIKVSNFADKEQSVLITDQLPVSEMERVTVKLKECTPTEPDNEEDGPGLMKWRLTLPPGQSGDIDLIFSVTAPDDVYLGDTMMF